jgi:hypothetical protein
MADQLDEFINEAATDMPGEVDQNAVSDEINNCLGLVS